MVNMTQMDLDLANSATNGYWVVIIIGLISLIFMVLGVVVQYSNFGNLNEKKKFEPVLVSTKDNKNGGQY